MDEVESPRDRRKEARLLNVLTEAILGPGAVRRSRTDHRNGEEEEDGRRCTGEEPGREREEEVRRGSSGGGGGRPAAGAREDEERGGGGGGGDGEREEREYRQKVLGALRELSVFHADGVTAWREVVREGARRIDRSPPGGGDQQHPSTTDTENPITPGSDSFTDTFLSVGEDIDSITDKLNSIITKLDEEILKVSAEEASTEDAAVGETRDPEASAQNEDDKEYLNSSEPEPGHEQEVDDPVDPRCPPDSEGTSPEDSSLSTPACNDVEETKEELVVENQGNNDEEGVSPDDQTDFLEETETYTNRKNETDKKETKDEWITVGLTGQQDDSGSNIPDACFIRAPAGAAEVLRCEVADALSCLMVTGSEELVSRVIRVRVRDGASFPFPATVVMPFCARYRGNYRDVAVKVVDGERRASYITPVTTEGAYGGQRGSFAEVRVYSLGLFAVVSCLKRENYTVPTKGLSLKLPMDPRICLNYLPGSFTAPVMAQTMIQPVDAVILSAVKSRSNARHSVASTSPLLYLAHPSSQPLRRPLTLSLPCPPNPEKKRHVRGQVEDQDLRTRPVSSSSLWDEPGVHRRRILGGALKSKETSNELLVVLGFREKMWSVLDKVTVRNQQNGLVSFELTENFDRLLVVRLISPLSSCLLVSLAEELEESVSCHSVAVVLQRRPEEPHAVLVAAVPSRDLGWEVSKLRGRGYGGVAETSPEICMREGDQLVLRFSGNITSKGSQSDKLTFHSQQKNHLLVHLTEVDPFGNYSSPHYKGTAMFYKVTRGQLEWSGDRAALVCDEKLLGDPVCKLSLTLPKKVRSINRPITTRVKLCEETDSLSDALLLWLSGELSEEEVALLVLSLRLRRSAAQLVKLRAGANLSAQVFHVLAMWRRGLPAVGPQPKASQLAQCLAKSGRPDLARELLLRQAASSRQSPLKQGGIRITVSNHS